MRGIDLTQPKRRVCPRVGTGRGRIGGSLARLVVVAGVLVTLVVTGVTAAQAVTFTGPVVGVGNAPQSLALGEFNGDSNPDMAVVNEFSHDISVVLGAPGGSFGAPTNYAVGQRPLWLAIGEFNGDSDSDIAVVNESNNDVSVFLGGPGGSFTGPANFPAGSKPQAVAVGEFNGDSDPDLAVVNEATNDVSILLAGPGGTFGTPTNFPVGSSPRSVVVGDFNGDSRPDLATANELSNDISVLLGSSGGSLSAPTNFPVGAAPTSLVVGRFNPDSDPDLAVANELSHTVSVLLGGTGGSFIGPTDYTAGSLPDTVAVGEFNGDSDQDIAVANQGSDNISLLFGAVGGTFTGPVNFAAGDGPTAMAIGDVNGDSARDIAVANELSNNVSILLATPPETTIDSGPSGLTNDSTPTFTFTSNDTGATFQCRLNAATFSSCTSPHTTAGLADGTHTVEVRAVDDAHRTDPTPAARSFTVDTVPPSLPAFTSSDPDSYANDNHPRLKGTAAASTTIRVYRAATTADCTPANLVATGAAADFAASGLTVSVPDNSTTRFRASAIDEAGNASNCSTSSITYIELTPPPPPGGTPPGGGGPGGPPAGGGGILDAIGSAVPDKTGPVMALAAKAVKLDKSGIVAVAVSCPASEPGGCTGNLALETLSPVRISRALTSRRGSRKRKIKLGVTSFQVAGGQTTVVKLRLSKKSQRIVRKLRKVRVVALIDARDRAGNSGRARKTLTLKAARSRS